MIDFSHSIDAGQLTSEEDLKRNLVRGRKKSIVHPDMEIEDLDNSYRVKLTIPGVTRDEILIDARKNILSVMASPRKAISREQIGVREPRSKSIRFKIRLPLNVDPEFASAEYKEGALQIHLHKLAKPHKNKFARIIAY